MSRELRAGLALALATFLWSGNFIAGRALRDDVDPATLNLLRWAACLLLLLPWVAAKAWRERRAVWRQRWLLVALGVTGIASFHTLVYLALQRAGAIDALLLLCLTPVATLAGAALSRSSRPSAAQWIGAGLSLLGAAIVVTRGEPGRWAGLGWTSGTAPMLAAVALWAAYSLLLRRRDPDLSVDVAFAASIVPALVVLLAFVALGSRGAPPAPTLRLVSSLAYIVVFASLVGFLLWAYGVATIGPERSAAFLNLMPLFGALQATLLLGETIVGAQVGGAACVLAGLALVGRSDTGARPAPSAAARKQAAPTSP